MPTSIREFNIGLYLEHLEEASFLYEQRLAYLHDTELNWPDLLDWEERFEAHIDALIVGGELALRICRQQAVNGDAGQLHAALPVFCRQNRKDDVFAVLGAFDPANENAARAIAHALRREAPTAWRDDLVRAFQREQHLTGVLAEVIGYRRFPVEDVLRGKLDEQPLLGRAELAWALGRVGTAASVRVLRALLDSEDERVCEAAAFALMRLGDDCPLPRALDDVGSSKWARQVLAIGGNPRALPVLLDAINSEGREPDDVIRLGLLGDLVAVAPLMDLLDHAELAAAAAMALNTITGAQLHAQVFVPDTFDPDELSGDEREAFERDGMLPKNNGKPYGNWIRQPLLDKTGWNRWLAENKHRFSRQHRWRMGRPYGPAALLECLKSPTSPYLVRAASYEELVVRFQLDVPFEVDLPVAQQQRFLEKIEAWVVQHSDSFDDGRWYFGGQLQA